MLPTKQCVLNVLVTVLLSLIVGVSAHAHTDYIPLERDVDIRIFEKYLDLVESEQDVIAALKHLASDDRRWKDASSKFANTISSVGVSLSGDVLLKNDKFNFKIVFTPEYSGDKIKWTCKIEDDSVFFRPKNCNSWSKVIRNGPPK